MLSIARSRWLHIALLVALPFAVYANNYRHAYHLDDAYTLVSNPSVRSLRAIPSYFRDPGTYTTLREQADYRPVLQSTYALNYRMGGYVMWWWHFTQIALHVIVTLGLYALCLRVLTLHTAAPAPAIGFALGSAVRSASGSAVRSAGSPLWTPFAAASLFAVHPASSGVVNYINARSSLLTAAFVLPALIAYMRSADTDKYSRPQWAAALLYTLALFTKVEAVGALGAFWAFDLWQRGRENPDASVLRAARLSMDRRTLARLTPALAITAVYFVIRWRVMAPFPFDETRHAADVGASTYLATQLTAWWYYVGRWVAPIRLVADYLAYPVFRSWLDPVVLLAAGAWIAVGALLVAAWKRAPYLLFLSLAALAFLSPTSSFAPLAEMVNEHRPYLPTAILSLAAVIPIGSWLKEWPRGRTRLALAAGGAVIFASLCVLTYHRNEAFSTPKRFWADVLAKAPSSRAHLNYGIALMKDNEMRDALRQFHTALELAPSWYYTHINLGVAYQHVGQTDSARAYFDRAVQDDRFSGLALTWRGEFRLAQRDYAGARDDFSSSLPLGLQRYRNLKGLATAYAGLGDASRAALLTTQMLAIDHGAALGDIPAISTPFFQSAERRADGRRYFESLLARLPGERWLAENISRLGAAQPPDTSGQTAMMALGLDLLYKRNRPAEAAEQFRGILRRNSLHYGATYQLARALDRSGDTTQARELWVKVLGMATSYRDAHTAETARVRLAGR